MAAGTDRPVTVLLPDQPPTLAESGWRAILRLLVQSAEEELGPDWRTRIAESAAGEAVS